MIVVIVDDDDDDDYGHELLLFTDGREICKYWNCLSKRAKREWEKITKTGFFTLNIILKSNEPKCEPLLFLFSHRFAIAYMCAQCKKQKISF